VRDQDSRTVIDFYKIQEQEIKEQ